MTPISARTEERAQTNGAAKTQFQAKEPVLASFTEHRVLCNERSASGNCFLKPEWIVDSAVGTRRRISGAKEVLGALHQFLGGKLSIPVICALLLQAV